MTEGASRNTELDVTAGLANGGARLSLFLNLKTPAVQGVKMEVSRIDIFSDGIWLPVSLKPMTIDAAAIGSGQLFLGRAILPFGAYQRLRFTFSQASVLKNDGDRVFLALDTPTTEVDLPDSLDLERGDSHSLFITWDVADSLRTPPILQPTLGIAPRLKQMVSDLAFVSCPDIDTIFVIRTDKNWVCNSLGVSGHPTYLAADATTEHKRLFVLATREAAIKVVDLQAENVVDVFRIPMTTTPEFMTLSPNRESAYVLDAEEGYLMRLDPTSGNMLNRVRVGYLPQYATYIADHNLLAVVSTRSQSVFFLDPVTLTEMEVVSTGLDPQGLGVLDNLLYIAESGANTVSIYDLQSRTIRSRLNVGFAPQRILSQNNQIYISNHDSDSISILQPDQLSIAREINLNGHPLEMAADANRKWLYVGNETIDGLTVVDTSTNRVAGQIILGATPKGIAVIE